MYTFTNLYVSVHKYGDKSWKTKFSAEYEERLKQSIAQHGIFANYRKI